MNMIPEQEAAMRNCSEGEQGCALVDGLILLVFLIVVPLLLLVYCGGKVRHVADWGASRIVSRRACGAVPGCAGEKYQTAVPAEKSETKAPVASPAAPKP